MDELGLLMGVSGQTIYNWEAKGARLRGDQGQRIAALRHMGRRDVRAALQSL